MESDNTVLYAASVAPLKDQKLYRQAYSYASSERRKKADSYRFEKDKCLCIGAELLLQYGLRSVNERMPAFCMKTNSYGKPALDGLNLHFNISHSEDWAVCAVSDHEVGCDIEKIKSADIKIAERFFCPEEYVHITEQVSADERNLLFYRYWTLKESFMKATGLGMNLPLDAFQIQLGESIRVKQSLDQRTYSFEEFDTISGYCCSVCSIGDVPKVQLKILDLSQTLSYIR